MTLLNGSGGNYSDHNPAACGRPGGVRKDGFMRLRIFTEPQQGADYGRQLAVARAAEELGFDAFFRSDHYLKMGDVSGLPGPTDSWLTLAGLAVQTSRIRLGTLVSSATFRYPGPLAISVAQADEMSGGRIELGLGAGWFEAEHAAYGIPFPATGERFDRLAEQLAVITGLWDTPVGETFSFDGRYYPVTRFAGAAQAGAAAAPADPGRRARTEADATAGRPVRGRVQRGVLHRGGDRRPVRPGPGGLPGGAAATPASLAYSAAHVTCCGRDEAELARRAAAIGRDLADLRADGLVGSPAEIVDRIGQFAGHGASRMYLQILDLHDLDHLELLATEVMPQVR